MNPPLSLVALAVLSQISFAKTWNCRNTDFEIRCDAKSCEAEKDFSPVIVSVADNNSVDVCAYSGCWGGKGVVSRKGGHVLVSAAGLKWTSNPKSTASFMIGIDTADQVGFVKGGGFAMPLHCKYE